MAEASESEVLQRVKVREVVEAELQDARHRSTKHRERISWLQVSMVSVVSVARVLQRLMHEASVYEAWQPW